MNATPALKNVKMTLPAGMTVSPSAADGLQACSDAQFGLGTEFGPGSQHTEPAKPASCPLASQIGTVEVFTPLLSGAPTVEGVPHARANALTVLAGHVERQPGRSPTSGCATAKPIPGATGKRIHALRRRTGRRRQGAPVSGHGDQRRRQLRRREPGRRGPPRTRHGAARSRRRASRRRAGPPSAGNTLTCEPSGAWTGEPGTDIHLPVAAGRRADRRRDKQRIHAGLRRRRQGHPVPGDGHQRGRRHVIADSAAVVASPAAVPAAAAAGGGVAGPAVRGLNRNARRARKPTTMRRTASCSVCSYRSRTRSAGVLVKLHGTTSANEETGQLTTTFVEQPQQPFELLQLKLKGGPRATLANPQSCGPATTSADLTPWSAPFTPDATPTSSFNVDWNGAGGACPGTLPFNPSFNAGTTGPTATTAGASARPSRSRSPAKTANRTSRGSRCSMPPGLVGKIAAIPQCGEAKCEARKRQCGCRRKPDRHDDRRRGPGSTSLLPRRARST